MMTTTNTKPDCFENAECYNVNNGKCGDCEYGIECAYNFMVYLNSQMSQAITEYNQESTRR